MQVAQKCGRQVGGIDCFFFGRVCGAGCAPNVGHIFIVDYYGLAYAS
eukprot:SAG25_NODE_178_length_12673_cov_19.868459_6_plen_47_part_00